MDVNKIGELIKKIRKDNNLTQNDFANKFGVTYQAVSKWENGKNIPDVAILKEICKEYNLSLDEVLDNNTEKKHNNKKMLLSIVMLLLIIVIVIFLTMNNGFVFKTISSNCDDFTVTGSIAYNNERTSIYISNVYYCGNKEKVLYKNIKCSLYEDDGNIKKVVDKTVEKEDLTLRDFLENLSFNVDNYNAICKKYTEESLYLEIEAKDNNNKIITYKIPLKLSDNCNKK